MKVVIMMKYDVAILGGGPGGYVAAIRAAQLGMKVLLIEKERLGGVCLNKGCIPTKTLLKCSSTYSAIKKSEMYGISVEGVKIDFKKIMARKQKVVTTLVNGIKGLMKANGVEVVEGEGKIVDATHITVNEENFEASNIIIATGSKPFIPNIKGIESKNVLDSDKLLSINELPQSMVIIGGGVIGLEFGVLLSELGCKVTIIEMMEDILFMADTDVIVEARGILTELGVEIIVSARVIEISGNGVVYEKDGQTYSVKGEKVLVASGRAPNVDIDQLNKLGIKHDRGKIVTDDRMRTNIKGIYAIGDVNGKYMLAHVASEEGIVAVVNISGNAKKMIYKTIPQCIYSHPEISWVGLTEKEARSKGYDVIIGKFPIAANGKSITEGDVRGFVKVVLDKKYKEILGVHLVCHNATDMIAEAVLAINMEATALEIAETIHPHPTVSEAIMEAFDVALGKPVHTVKSK